MASPGSPPYCVDGTVRSPDEEHRLNQLFRRVFNTDDGKKVLAYLRGQTINMVHGPEYDPKHLPHMEGQRFIVHVIETRTLHGRESQPPLVEKGNDDG